MTYTQHWAQDYVRKQLEAILYRETHGFRRELPRWQAQRTAIYNSAVKEGVINGWMKGLSRCTQCAKVAHVRIVRDSCGIILGEICDECFER